MTEYIIVAKYDKKLHFEWIVQQPFYKNQKPNNLLANIDKALVFHDAQEARNFAKEFGKHSVMKYEVFIKEYIITHQIMDS